MACFKIVKVLVTWLSICFLLITFGITISEMGRRDFTQSFLNRLLGGADFVWHSRSPRGRSDDILVGVMADTMDVLACSDGEFHVKLHICNKIDNFTWSLVAIYGAAQDEFKADFLYEMVFLKWRYTPSLYIQRMHTVFLLFNRKP
jgi:hypothetical protein